MATAYRGFQLGLLPERKINKKAVATAYGIVALVVLIVISISILLPERLQLTQYHVTELIPMPSLRPEPEPVKVVPQVHAKLLPAVKIPVMEQPKLIMPKEIRREAPKPVEAPRIVEAGSRRGASATGAHRRFHANWKFADADGECCRPEDTDRRIWRPQRTAWNRQAGREVIRRSYRII
jgi:hypothetical protein